MTGHDCFQSLLHRELAINIIALLTCILQEEVALEGTEGTKLAPFLKKKETMLLRHPHLPLLSVEDQQTSSHHPSPGTSRRRLAAQTLA